MATIDFTLNGEAVSLAVDGNKPLLWVLREDARLHGTRFGCGMAQCGACTVHLDGNAVRACVTPLSAAQGKEITTIEGNESDVGKAVIAAWRELDVVQCGYCQSGQIMSATSLLTSNPQPTDEEIDGAMRGNLCRCGTYVRIRAAIHKAAEALEA